jgi:hypothetical protein
VTLIILSRGIGRMIVTAVILTMMMMMGIKGIRQRRRLKWRMGKSRMVGRMENILLKKMQRMIIKMLRIRKMRKKMMMMICFDR